MIPLAKEVQDLQRRVVKDLVSKEASKSQALNKSDPCRVRRRKLGRQEGELLIQQVRRENVKVTMVMKDLKGKCS